MRTSTTILVPPHPQQQQHQDHKENEDDDKRHPMIWLNQNQNSLSRDTTTTNSNNNSNHKSGSTGTITTNNTGGNHVSLLSSSITNCDMATANRYVLDQWMLQLHQNIITTNPISETTGVFHGLVFSSTMGMYTDGDTGTLNSYKTDTPNKQMSRFSSMR